MGWPRWRYTLNEAKRLAVKAIDEYNCSTGHYGDFIGTMVRAWLYLLQAEFQRDKIDYCYKDQDGKSILIDGEPSCGTFLGRLRSGFRPPTIPSGSTWRCSSHFVTRWSTGMSMRSRLLRAVGPTRL